MRYITFMKIKQISFIVLASLIMTSSIGTLATQTNTGTICNGNGSCDTATSPSVDVQNTIDTYNSVYNSINTNTSTSATGYGGSSSNTISTSANGGSATGVGYGGSSSVYESGNSYNDITNTNRATGGAGGSSDATAYGGSQTQGQGQEQSSTNTATTGNNSTIVNTGSTEVANKTITYKKAGYDLPPAAPAISPTVIGQMGTTSVSGAVSTPFGGISGGFSRTNKEGKDLMKAQAEALRVQSATQEAMIESQVIQEDIRSLKEANELNEEDRAIIREFILRKYR